MIALVLELSGIPSLAFAVGVYLPLSSSTPIFVGGWCAGGSIAPARRGLEKKNIHLSEEELTAEGDKSPGVLMASGYIAGGAIAAVLIAFSAGVLENVDASLTKWATDNNPFFNSDSADLLSMIPFRPDLRAAADGGAGDDPDGEEEGLTRATRSTSASSWTHHRRGMDAERAHEFVTGSAPPIAACLPRRCRPPRARSRRAAPSPRARSAPRRGSSRSRSTRSRRRAARWEPSPAELVVPADEQRLAREQRHRGLRPCAAAARSRSRSTRSCPRRAARSARADGRSRPCRPARTARAPSSRTATE